MAIKKDGKWMDAGGDYVPVKYVDKIIKLRDGIVDKHVLKAKKMNKELCKWKAELQKDIEAYWAAEREEYGKDSSNPGQNKHLADFANRNRIEIAASQALDFDDRVWIARDKLFEFIEQAAAGSKDIDGIKVIVKNAYSTNRFGKLDHQRIMSLLALGDKINHPLVTEACQIIKECMFRLDRKIHHRFASKEAGGAWETIELYFNRV